MDKKIEKGTQLLALQLKKRLGDIQTKISENRQGIAQQIFFRSPLLKAGNEPRIFSHGKFTKNVIVLFHGLSDSPHYMDAVGRRFYEEGFNVILPLLPAHGLLDPSEKIEDYELHKKWIHEVDVNVNAAKQFGEVISLGGFSTGASLSVHKVLRNPRMVKGALFLFSAALDLGLFIHGSSRLPFAQTIARYTDGKQGGIGPNPYRYPVLSTLAGIKVVEIVNECWEMLEGKTISQPVFVAHSVHDIRVSFHGIQTFLTKHTRKAIAFLVAENITHAELVLSKKIEIAPSDLPGYQIDPKPNPKFDWMMDNAIWFFKKEV